MPLLCTLFLPFYLSAASLFVFSEQELLEYQQRFGDGIEARVKGFETSLESIRKDGSEDLLERVNTLINSYLPEYDDVVNGREDYWSTPKEFLAAGYGDCEEYAIMKYFTLQSFGFKEDDLCLGVVRDRYSGNHHMVLNVYRDGQGEPLVLDNLSFRILELSRRTDLVPLHCINRRGVFRLDAHGKRIRLQKKDANFEDLMKRIGQGR